MAQRKAGTDAGEIKYAKEGVCGMCMGFNAGVMLKTLVSKVRSKKVEPPAKTKKTKK